MTVLKQLALRVLFSLTVLSIVSCQSKTNTTSKQVIDSATKGLRLSRQLFRDSLPQPHNYVNDYENLYTDTEEAILDSLLLEFENRTTMQIAVVTFDTTMTTKDSLEDLTLRIAKFWGVGQKDKNNGVTIGICKGHRKMSIQNGYGIEKNLTNPETKEIIDTAFIPKFKEGKYFEGTLNGLKILMAILIKKSQQEPKVKF